MKCTPAQAAAGVPYVMLPNTWEIIGGRKVVFQPPDPQTWFRYFGTLAEGMRHHVAFLRARYRLAWHALVSGDPTLFASELKRLGYFTASLEAYAGAMRHLHAEWMRTVDYEGPLVAVEPNEPMGGIVHGDVVDWNNAQRETDRRAKLDEAFAMLSLTFIGGLHRYDEEAAA